MEMRCLFEGKKVSDFFKLEATSGKARAGKIKTAHGEIQTPIFMPVGTRGTIKTMDMGDMEEIGAQIILGNTYHLYLRPGHELIAEMGGLHKYSTWSGPILTDSGGYQVFSLSDLNKVTEEGVVFQSHIDGSRHMLSPEKSMEIQKALGSDIVMVFDECPKLPATREVLEKSLELTLRWAKRCQNYELQPHQHLFGITQGGLDLNLRMKSLEALEKMNFPGLAIGGLSVGEKNEEMQQLLQSFVCEMPKNKPRYLMGVGKPLDILNAIREGVDMFDCVLPTRNARNGGVLTWKGALNIKNEKFRKDETALDPDCQCKVCKRYSRSYIRHLFNVGEHTAGHLISFHNLYFYLDLVKKAREAILQNRFEEFYTTVYKSFAKD